MIKIWNEKNNKSILFVLNKEELNTLKIIEIYEDTSCLEAKSKIMRYLLKKYNLIVLSDIEDIKLLTMDKKIYEIYKKIDKKMDKLA